jgi:hypothetical protein
MANGSTDARAAATSLFEIMSVFTVSRSPIDALKPAPNAEFRTKKQSLIYLRRGLWKRFHVHFRWCAWRFYMEQLPDQMTSNALESAGD